MQRKGLTARGGESSSLEAYSQPDLHNASFQHGAGGREGWCFGESAVKRDARGGVDAGNVRVIEQVIGFKYELRLHTFPKSSYFASVTQIDLINVRTTHGVTSHERGPRDRRGDGVAVEDRIHDDVLLISGGEIRQNREHVPVDHVTEHRVPAFPGGLQDRTDSEGLWTVRQRVTAITIDVGWVLDWQVLLEAIGIRRIADRMRPSVRGTQFDTLRQTVRVVHNQRVIVRPGATLLKRDGVEFRVQTSTGAGVLVENGPAIRQRPDRIDQVHVVQVFQIPASSVNVAECECVTAGELLLDLQAEIHGVSISEIRRN